MDCNMQSFPVLHYPWVYSNSCPLSQWCHPTNSSSVFPFSSRCYSFPGLASFPMSLLFASGGQSIAALASVLPMNIQGWFPLGLTGLISLLLKGLSRVFFSTTIWKHQFFGTQPSLWSNSHIRMHLLESSPLLSAIRVVSSAYLRFFIFLVAILIPACNSASLAFCMMCSVYKLNKQSDNIKPCHTGSQFWTSQLCHVRF